MQKHGTITDKSSNNKHMTLMAGNKKVSKIEAITVNGEVHVLAYLLCGNIDW